MYFLWTIVRTDFLSPGFNKNKAALNKIASQQRPTPHVLYPRETKSWWCEGGGGDREGEEKVHLLTHATTRGVGKDYNAYTIPPLTNKQKN